MPVQVLDNLFIGGLDDVENVDTIQSLGIKCILTVDSKPLMNTKQLVDSGEVRCDHVRILDLDTEDLLSHLPNTTQLIDRCRSEESPVIVHCHAGRSRSASVVIAYLMWKLQMSYKDSFKYLRKLKPDIRPNDGFVEQLRMFEAMEWKLDRTSPIFRQYQLERISHMISQGKELAQLTGEFESYHSSQNLSQTTYKCKKCRRLLLTEGQVIPHTEGGGEATFLRPWEKRTQSSADIRCTSSLFVEPVQWMLRLGLHEQQGKISCVKCGAKIGSWSWSGERCNCGTWVTPAFHIDTKKVDKSVPVSALKTVATNQPS